MSQAQVLTAFGGPEVLQWNEVEPPLPQAGEIRIRVRAAGVGPTDLAIRRGDLARAFPVGPGSILGFEAAGEVDAIGAGVQGLAIGAPVAAQLFGPRLGGYAEYALATSWSVKPDNVSWSDAAGVPASAEAALGTLRQLKVTEGDTVLILGGGGAVGLLAVQFARRFGAHVVAAVGDSDRDLVAGLGATPIRYGEGVIDRARAVGHIDAVLDAAGKGGLIETVELLGDTSRVITLSDPTAHSIGVRLSSPTPDRAPDAVGFALELLAKGELTLRDHLDVPLDSAADAHRMLESGHGHQKMILRA